MSFQAPVFLALLLPLAAMVVVHLRASPKVPPGRRRAFLALRVAAGILLILGLARPSVMVSRSRTHLAFLMDVSQSMGPGQVAQALDVIQGMREQMGPRDTATLIQFGRNAVPRDLGPETTEGPGSGEQVDGTATDIGGALGAAVATFPEHVQRRIVLLTDGSENLGNAQDAAGLARSFTTPIFTVPLSPPASGREARIETIIAPSPVREGEAHEITVEVRSEAETQARLTVLRDGQPFASWEGLLKPGKDSVSFSGEFASRGRHSYDAVLESEGDPIQENNRARALVEVTGAPAILYATTEGLAPASLRAALAAQGILVVSVEASQLPGTFEEYLPYEAVILDDVAGSQVSLEKMSFIERYVKEAGGGFAMLGGENSFGPGGYDSTPIERILPVDMEVTRARIPRVTLVIVADASGSMDEVLEDAPELQWPITKLDVLKSAALSAIDMLSPSDKVGVLAFESLNEWVLPVVEARDEREIRRGIASMRPGGATELYSALGEAYRVIASSRSPLRHIIALTDGLTNPGDFETLTRLMARDGITVSTVAIGGNADSALLEQIAQWGGGRYYATTSPREISTFFAAEVWRLNQGALLEGEFTPSLGSSSEILDGIPVAELPPLDGFVLTSMRPGGLKVITALYEAPLLAVWQYGLGRTAAFTSDLKGRWGKAWEGWEAYPRLVAQLVRWIERPAQKGLLHPRITVEKGVGTIAVEASDEVGTFVNGLSVSATVHGPGSQAEQVAIRQTGPGQYEGTFPAERLGDYLIELSGQEASGREIPSRSQGMSLSYPDELRESGLNMPLLASLSEQTDGMVLDPHNNAEWKALFDGAEHPAAGSGTRVPVDLWLPLVIAGLCAFFLDIASRQASLPEAFARKIQSWRERSFGKRIRSRARGRAATDRAREAEKRAMVRRITGMTTGQKIAPDLEGYLYVARFSRREKETHPEKPDGPAASRDA